jgi:hypothetical protein
MLSINYAFRPDLRPWLTLHGRTLQRNPARKRLHLFSCSSSLTAGTFWKSFLSMVRGRSRTQLKGEGRAPLLKNQRSIFHVPGSSVKHPFHVFPITELEEKIHVLISTWPSSRLTHWLTDHNITEHEMDAYKNRQQHDKHQTIATCDPQ